MNKNYYPVRLSKSAAFAALMLCCIFTAGSVTAQKQIKPNVNERELLLQLQIYTGAEDESKADFNSAKFFILDRDPVVLLRKMKLEESFIGIKPDKKYKISDLLYLQAAALILTQTEQRPSIADQVTDLRYKPEDTKEVDEQIWVLSFAIGSKFKKHVKGEVYFDNLLRLQRLKVPVREFYLFGFCRVGGEMIVWNRKVKSVETELELDQYNSEAVFSEEEFFAEVDKSLN